MKPSEIITADCQKRGIPLAPVAHGINHLLQTKKAIMLQSGDSLAVLRHLGNHTVEIHFFTADSPISMVSSIADLFKKIKQSSIKKVYGKADNPQIIKLMKKAGVNTKDSDKLDYNWMWAKK
jgi:phosphotransferase system IIA component